MNRTCQLPKILDADAIAELKKKIIKEYERYLKQLQRGYQNDYSFLMNEINFVETHFNLDTSKVTYEYFINHGM